MALNGGHESNQKSSGTTPAATTSTSVLLIISIATAAALGAVVISPELFQSRFTRPCSAGWSQPTALAGNSSSSSLAQDLHYKGISEHPACAFLRSGNATSGDEHHWGPYGLCMEKTNEWYQRSRTNCYSCLNPQLNVCRDPPMILYHQYLEKLHPKRWEGNLLSMKAFLLTQDLKRSRLTLWVLDPKLVYNNKTSAFFDAFSDYITIRTFNYQQEIKQTAWEGDQFFGNGTLVKEMMPAPGAYSDVVRILVLHKYGGLWMDNDVVFYNDVTHLLATSYQFVMRRMNLHIMYMVANSTLTWRSMELAKTLPLNHPRFQQEIIEKRCKPHGYYPLVAQVYGNTDIYNGCLHRLLLRFNNTGLPPEATLYDLPLGWWDHDWIGCFGSRGAIKDTEWHRVTSIYLSMHSRYPSGADTGPESSPLNRVIRLLTEFYSRCDNKNCVPVDGLPLIAYEGINEKPPSGRRH